VGDIKSLSLRVVRYLYLFEALFTVYLTPKIHLTAALMSFSEKSFFASGIIAICTAWKYMSLRMDCP
jgi:hypothetical protein